MSTTLLQEPYLVSPLRKHDAPPISDGVCAAVLAAGDVARELCERPAWIRGIDHRIEAHSLGVRDLTSSPSTALAAERAGVHDGPIDIAELHAPFTHQELIVREALGLDDSTTVNPSGGPLAANPIMAGGMIRIGEAAQRISRGEAEPGGGPRHRRSVPATEHGLRPGRGFVMGGERVAVVGIGQTKHDSTRGDLSIAGLVREAAVRALADAQMTFADIDAVVIGKAPDFFEGLMMPEYYLADALGAVGKPMFRVHTAGSVGGSTAIVASNLVASGVHKRVLTVAFEKQSESEAMWALSMPMPFQPPLVAGAGGYFAPYIRAYMRRAGAPDDTGILTTLKDRQNALKNPYAHLHEPDITYESVRDSMMIWDPIRYSETCPSSDGACAMVFTDEAGGDAHAGRLRAGLDPRHRLAQRADPHGRPRPGEPPGRPGLRQGRLRPGGDHRTPARRSTSPRSTSPSRGSRPCGWRTSGFADIGDGWKMVARRRHRHDRRHAHQLLRRRALDQPHRRLGHASLRRGRHAGAQAGRRAPDRRRPHGPRSRLRRRLAVLRHVDRPRLQALTG